MLRSERKLLKELKKMCKRKNIIYAGIEPGAGVNGTVFIRAPKEINLVQQDFMSFCSLMDTGYIKLFDKNESLYQLTYKAYQYDEQRIHDILCVTLGGIAGFVSGILSSLIVNNLITP